jgi:hypothetical protein
MSNAYSDIIQTYTTGDVNILSDLIEETFTLILRSQISFGHTFAQCTPTMLIKGGKGRVGV